MTTGPWHTWFAWHPIETRQHGWKWLQTVERAKHYPDPLIPFAPGPYWVYRPRRGGHQRMTNDDQNYPRSYKRLHGAPYDPDPGVATYLTVIGAVLIITIVLLILSIL